MNHPSSYLNLLNEYYAHINFKQLTDKQLMKIADSDLDNLCKNYGLNSVCVNFKEKRLELWAKQDQFEKGIQERLRLDIILSLQIGDNIVKKDRFKKNIKITGRTSDNFIKLNKNDKSKRKV
uniref:Uncharacterized protein n=1 Tax=viral metagenome TaxID=1070528 RepID=A0A6C0FDR8_9ZZZZ|tara:strand:- start:6654 stop:7019 length:366 start_codon:yes stop_codon:yes gene_type:complete